ncbi:bifunctional heptose 7-phosphate kinase/heptose 1-phosphate adenyltransferase [Candidatus Omnitrophus magneticus]|uniref:D-glycero-beta-D-manno-heptose 1-phosphate adenylyltransferase n=1 Tax=Candidatus Omnitrophus magneticus TaxID=1609969 RepID=A0A0F0CRS6_9BACT|nr:bifunctional heptose 7-phosphate kinase/heptose 1-phosphate adenyltransferase [Candidatus Omnitrophus magneticus]
MMDVRAKIMNWEKLAESIARAKATGNVIGFTNGCFDILHLGHARYLNAAKKECDKFIVAINSDSSVKRLKGPSRPINAENARVELIASLHAVDFVTIFEEDTPEKLIKFITPNILFKGGDWEEDKIAGAGYVKSMGGKVRIIAYLDGYSTTSLIDSLKK